MRLAGQTRCFVYAAQGQLQEHDSTVFECSGTSHNTQHTKAGDNTYTLPGFNGTWSCAITNDTRA